MDQERAIRVYRPPSVVTANLIVRGALFEAIGLFDESLRRGQDVDLADRAHFHHRATFAYAEGAVVRHLNPRTLAALFRKSVQHGRGVAGVLANHAAALGKIPWQRCPAGRRYARMAHAASRAVAGSHEGTRVGPLFTAVFKAGKQLGVPFGTARAALPRRGEPRSGPP